MKKSGMFLSLCLLASPALADRLDVSMRNVSVAEVIHNGSGCPLDAGAVSARMIAPNVIKIQIPEMRAKTGEGVSLRELRKNCQLGLTIAHPKGFSFQVTKALVMSAIDLRAGQKGEIKVGSYFQGDSASVQASKELVGPEKRSRYLHMPLVDAPMASCDKSRILNVNLSSTLERSEDAGALGIKGPVYLYLNWERCS